jgi:hypothetical protein
MESFAQSGEFPDFGLGEARVRVSASPELLGELDACVTAIATVTSTSADAQP